MLKINFKRFLPAIFTFTLVSLPCNAQQKLFVPKPSGENYTLIFRKAQNSFEAGDYGNAISQAEKAKEQRKNQTAWELYSLDQVQKVSAVRRAGDYFEDVLPVLLDYKEMTAYEIITSYIDSYGADFFKGRVSSLKAFLEKGYSYPEADYLIGKIYRLEGENALSMRYLNVALDSAENLDVPDVRYDILYELADLAMDNGNDADYEKYLLLVLKDDTFYMDNGFMASLLRIIENNTKDAVSKFFLLYRSNNDKSIKALELLTDYYNRTNEPSKALRCASLGSITALSRIQQTVQTRLPNYSYTNIENLLDRASLYEDIVLWGNRNNIWKLFFSFAQTCAVCDYDVFASELLSILSEHEPEPYWRTIAKNSVKSNADF